jgi:phosphatidylinositol alpha-mannosyltransferase
MNTPSSTTAITSGRTTTMKRNDSPLRVGLVLDDSLDSPDGVQQYILTLGAWLSAEGHEVHYLVGQTTRTDIPNIHSLARNWKVAFNGNRLSVPLPASRKRLRAVVKAQNFDVLHVQTPYSPFMAGRLLHLIGRDTAVVGTFHILPYDRMVLWANRFLALLNHHTAKRFDQMIANSAPSKAFADSTYGFTSSVIPNPFPLATFSVATPAANEVPTIVFLGRLVERKGARQLLEAIAAIREQTLYEGEFRVIIGGKGVLLAELQAFVKAHQLQSIVNFAGFVSEADKPTFLAQADIAVFPSVSGESFGISLLEAMAAARGVVLGGNNPGYRSVLEPLHEDRLVQPNDVASFAAQLASWLGDSTARDQASREQKAYVQQFDVAVVGQQVVEIYSQALRQRRNVR